MITLQFLAEWTLRSSILILSGALLLWALRIRDSSIRLTAWTAMLCASLAIPALTAALPGLPLTPLTVVPTATRQPSAPLVPGVQPAASPEARNIAQQSFSIPKHFDLARAALTIYVLMAFTLLLRLCVGLVMALRLLRASRATGETTEGIEIRESDRVTSPLTLGIARPAIVLPLDWPQWDRAKLDAVLVHERSHIGRHDPAVQLLSAIHRALLWHSPLSWFLHQRIVWVAEEASDDAAMAAAPDRPFYAEVLLDFMRRGNLRGMKAPGIPMARYGRVEERIQRILDGTTLSRGVTRWSVAAILAFGSPLAYVVAAAHPRLAPQAQTVVPPATIQVPSEKPAAPAPNAAVAATRSAPVYLLGLGNVTPFYTVTIKPRVDGQLMSVNFKEGELVEAGQLLASIDLQPYELQLAQAEAELAQAQGMLAQVDGQLAKAQAEIGASAAQARLNNAKLQLQYTQITSPIRGVAGLRMVDPGNMVHAADATGLVVVTQLQPIAVLFNIVEDAFPQVRSLLGKGVSIPVEAWNRDSTVKLATGYLIATDNRIDSETGTLKLKAIFDNKDGALFPNQFVNVKMLLNAP